MKNTVLSAALTALLLAAGCSTTTTLSIPKQHPEKYALQIVQIEVPLPDTYKESSPYVMGSDDVDSLLKNPQAMITKYPAVYAAVGETAINDQTETISLPQFYEPKTNENGTVSVVYTHHKDVKIGKYIEYTLQKIENGGATGDLWFFDRSLAGSFTYEVAPATETQNAVTASMPKFKKRGMKTEITLAPGDWLPMGGLVSEKTENTKSGKTKTVRTKTVLAIRIFPPVNTL